MLRFIPFKPDLDNASGGNMKTILIFFTTLFISLSIYAEKLTIYTYDSFVSEWGPGPIIEKIFEEKHDADVEFVAVDSAATLLNKVILEGDTSKADIVLGLDMNLFDLAEKSGLFTSHNIKDINNLINLPLKWESNKFVPYNYGYFSFVYNEANLETPPKSMDELINSTNARIVIQDPRTSTPGLGLLTWMKALYGDKAGDEWKKLNKKIISVTKGWTDAYYNFFMAGEADMVLSYTTSPAAHIMFEERYDILATTFEEGNYITIEFAGILNNSQKKDLANKFLNFMLSEEFQSVIPSTNIMYPVTNIKDLPEAFDKLNIPKFIQIDPKEINKNKEKWINEWLNAS
jgi:thiamine transport system substrate-binding protein